MDLKLEGKQALGTGSTTGIGVCKCRSIGKGRASVVVNGRTEQRVKAALKQLQHSGTRGKVEGFSRQSRHRRRGAASNRPLSCAGHPGEQPGDFEARPFEQISDDDWFHFLETNVLSGVRLSRHFCPG